jgi:hypothetical protein
MTATGRISRISWRPEFLGGPAYRVFAPSADPPCSCAVAASTGSWTVGVPVILMQITTVGRFKLDKALRTGPI